MMATASKQKRCSLSRSSLVGLLLVALCFCSSLVTVRAGDDDAYENDAFESYYYNMDDDKYAVDDKAFYYNNGQGNYNQYYNNQDNYNGNYGDNYNNDDNGNNNDDGNGNDDGNYNNDDANDDSNDDDNANNNNDDANDDANGNANDDGKNYDYQDAFDDENKQWEDDDLIAIDVDGFDGVSISPVSCVNYNNGHFIKFQIYETANSYQCHFGELGSFVVSIAHYMRAYFNYQALTYGSSFSLPDDVGYLNCIPLKMQNYGFDFVYEDDASGDGSGDGSGDEPDRRLEESEEDQDEQAILYAKVGCLNKETSSSTAFQLHVYTDDKCTEPYDDGQTDQEHARKGYNINLDKYYAATLDEDDDSIQYTDYPVNTVAFKTKVSFRPSFYKCQTCKPAQISNTFNKFSGTFYDDDYIGRYGMTQSAYSAYMAELEAQKEEECDDCQYYTYLTDDSNDGYTVQQVDDAYFNTVDDDYSNVFADDYNNNDDGGNGRQLRLSNTPSGHEEKAQSALKPFDKEFKKFELDFWEGIENQRRSLYEDIYGGVDDWNMCEQVYKYGLYCDEECQSLDAFRSNQWSSADIVLLSIMCTFMGAMMILVAAKHKNASTVIKKQQSFYSENDYDPNRSGYSTNEIPGLPPIAMLTIFCAIMLTIMALAFVNFVNETLVFAVVCCILLFIYMLKITLFSVQKRPVLLMSPNHEDVFGYSNEEIKEKKKGGFFS